MILVLFILISLPKILWQSYFLKKKFPTLKERFGFFAPEKKGELRIWIHAVSVGEVKAAEPLIAALSKKNPTFLITTATLAGKEEALRSHPHAVVKIMPLDFSVIMRRWLKIFAPHYLLFIEGDLWPNLLREAKRRKIKTALVSGKISERSVRRFLWVPAIARSLFGSVDYLCVQSEEQRSRFAKLTDRLIHVTGNLKLEAVLKPVDPTAIREQFKLGKESVITIASTHAPEEDELLDIFSQIPELIIFLAPRHPERFQEVAALLEKKRLAFCRWNQKRKEESIILVDVMGQLSQCFAVSALALVAGSFSSRVGGHNIWEPCSYGCPVLFGPHMHAQKELVELILQAGAGKQVELSEIVSVVEKELKKPSLSCKKISSQRISERVTKLIFHEG